MAKPVILLVEDDLHIQELLQVSLEQEGYRIVVETDGKAGLARARREHFDLVILDVMLPGLDGLTICRELSSGDDPTPPILILTARGDETDKVLGLKLGADDYMVKPFSPRELAARVEAILRRVGKSFYGDTKILRGKLNITPALHQAVYNGVKLSLTPKEFELLLLLACRPGRLFTREELLSRIWGFDYLGGSRTVDEHVKNLRQKIKGAGASSPCIQTVWGLGYKFEVLEP